MPPAAALTELFTQDALVARWQALVEYARHDPLGFGFWSLVWIGSFTTTFLLLRALFTHWGDTQVTRKTMAVSLLAHLILGMVSTRLVLSESSPPAKEVIVRPRQRQVKVGDELPVSRLPGKAPVWERPPELDSDRPERSNRNSALPESTDLAQRQPSTNEQPLPIPLPDLPVADELPTMPEPQRTPERLSRPVEISPTPIAEETADARNETKADGGEPQRATRTAPAAESPEPRRASRPEKTEQLQVTAPAATDSAAAMAAADPQAKIERGTTGEQPRKKASPETAAAPAADGGTTGQPSAAGAGTLTTKPFARSGRRAADQSGSGVVDRMRTGEASAAAETGPSRIVASRSGSADPSSQRITPDLARSDSAGVIDKDSGKVPAPYRLRGLPQRKKFAIEMGATEESEKAVEASLAWLARHQHPAGNWPPLEAALGHEPDEQTKFKDQLVERQRSGLQSDSGLTALALLAFLGSNYTHEDNLYSDTVDRGLRWLIAQQDTDGYLGGRANRYAGMYCHGMATIALGEAYGMTKDPALREPLARAVQYLVERQNPSDGGWRYTKADNGDVSMFGWQLMALRSAHTAGVQVPRDTITRAREFLDTHLADLRTRGLSRQGGLAGYRKLDPPKRAMTAEALFCKQMLGQKRTSAAATEAVDYLLQSLPSRPQQDVYYWYYGTLAMYHHGGEPWRKWNRALRDNLVSDQRTDGDMAGSWNPRAPWGDYGGRVFSTALSTLCLEVYYRFLPLYQTTGRPEDVAEKPGD
ncbi:MAG: hypothetical protein EXS05_19750 [Planctomycetaceae bacterium]|nr:hypothetical protein [Planctomycetaceae bacterium]